MVGERHGSSRGTPVAQFFSLSLSLFNSLTNRQASLIGNARRLFTEPSKVHIFTRTQSGTHFEIEAKPQEDGFFWTHN